MARIQVLDRKARVEGALDRSGDGRRTIGGDGVQPHPRRRYRWPQSANSRPAPSGRYANARVCLGLHRVRCCHISDCRAHAESAVLQTGPACARNPVLLFVHQALHRLLARSARVFPGHRAGGSLDCNARFARSQNSLVNRRGNVLDCRFRRHLFVPGFRVRLQRGTVQPAQAVWNRGRSLDSAVHARSR